MLWYLPSLLVQALTRLLTYASQVLLIVSFLISAAYAFGWIDRLIWYLAEKEVSKLMNGTPVTIGSLRVDVIRGKVWASNVVFHSPRRKEWKWESPVLARVGSLYVETNLVHCILSDWLLGEELPLVLDTIIVSDIQAFVERKQNIFNFYLVDPHWVLPDPQDIVGHEHDLSRGDSLQPADTSLNPASWELSAEEPSGGSDTNVETNEKAQQLMDDMVRAVQSLGRAAQEGSLQGALVEQRHHITSKLRALQTSKKTDAIKEGVKIAQQVGKSVVEKTQNAQHTVLPPRREIAGEKTVQSQFGRIVIRDARIFTRDHLDVSMTESNNSDNVNQTKSSWNKPISLRKVVFRPSDLCPSTSAKDEDGNPALYQPIEKCVDVIWKRLLAEMAKTDTGGLFNTAVSEVLDYYRMEKDAALPMENSY